MTNPNELWEDLKSFGLSAALEDEASAEAADRVKRRPQWAMAEFPIERVTGKVTTITRGSKTANNGLVLPQFELHIAEPYGVEGAYNGGEVVLNVIEPKKGGRNAAQAPLYWLLETAKALDPSVDNLADIIGITWTFELDARKKFEGAQYFDYYYRAVEKLSNRASAEPPKPFVLTDALRDAALNFAAGKVARDFAKGVMQDEAVRAAMGPNDRTAFQALVISEQFLKDAVSDGLLTTADDGTYERRTVGATA